ncbi:MAG TPA: response regulator [Anaerolineales bacterium]|nr:response regulator [Anaerolineales bacterium]
MKSVNESSDYILVVEDIPDILNLLDATLRFKGYRVVTAHNGQEALDIIQKERPALIIADILMPKMDGFSLVHRLRINPETRNIPVVFLSATYVAPEDREFALAIGVNRFIEKPVDLESFLPLIAELLSQNVPVVQPPISEYEFYEGYRKRLETKLHQKNAQIARSEHLLQTALSEEEKHTIRLSLQNTLNERDEIRRLIEEVRERLDKLSGKNNPN